MVTTYPTWQRDPHGLVSREQHDGGPAVVIYTHGIVKAHDRVSGQTCTFPSVTAAKRWASSLPPPPHLRDPLSRRQA